MKENKEVHFTMGGGVEKELLTKIQVAKRKKKKKGWV